METPKYDAERLEFIANSYQIHVDHICKSQDRRFEILRYAFVGLFAYFAFILSIEQSQFFCQHPLNFVIFVPVFILSQGVMYIWIINRNIRKHGEYIEYLFEYELKEFGLGTNLYHEFLEHRYYPKHLSERIFKDGLLHPSQVVLFVLMFACASLYVYVEIIPHYIVGIPHGFGICEVPAGTGGK